MNEADLERLIAERAGASRYSKDSPQPTRRAASERPRISNGSSSSRYIGFSEREKTFFFLKK